MLKQFINISMNLPTSQINTRSAEIRNFHELNDLDIVTYTFKQSLKNYANGELVDTSDVEIGLNINSASEA